MLAKRSFACCVRPRHGLRVAVVTLPLVLAVATGVCFVYGPSSAAAQQAGAGSETKNPGRAPLDPTTRRALAAKDAARMARRALAAKGAARMERFWQSIAEREPSPTMGVRRLFAYALLLCEAREHRERLTRLFELGAEAQDRDPESYGYGNFVWYWGHEEVTDGNAVEFCMQDALRIWVDHRRWLPEEARSRLREILEYAAHGCMRHRVPTWYTNIAVLNAGNLLVLGQELDLSEVAETGAGRLNAVYAWTWQFGTFEYCSPTYYSVDIRGLLFIEHYCRGELQKQQARALLELFWTDVALNWFPQAERLAGSQSRSYDYVRGLGGLHRNVQYRDWLDEESDPRAVILDCAIGDWAPPESLRELNRERFPRLVRQSWGMKRTQARTHMMHADVTLGSSAATYGWTDMPLAVDLPGRKEQARCYFIADGRDDPYGKNRFSQGKAGHQKALHLKPFWTAAQRRNDALGLVYYQYDDPWRPVDEVLKSHFVMRREVDGFWVGGRPVSLDGATPEKPRRVEVEPGQAVVFRAGTAAVGVRVVWCRGDDGEAAPVTLVDDGNPYGVVRLTVDHGAPPPMAPPPAAPSADGSHAESNGDDAPAAPRPDWSECGAAFWVRVGSGLVSDADFQRWRAEFERLAATRAEVDGEGIRLEVPGADGAVRVDVGMPLGQGRGVELQPEPTRAVLELDGQEIGRPLLEGVEPIRSYQEKLAELEPVVVGQGTPAAWEAESGLLLPDMVVGRDEEASGGAFVWRPLDEEYGRREGRVRWLLEVREAGDYYLWGRVFAPDAKTDSFFVRVTGETDELVPRGDWHTGHGPGWRWREVKLRRSRERTPLELPRGKCWLEFRAREAGTKIDRLFITADAEAKPPATRPRGTAESRR